MSLFDSLGSKSTQQQGNPQQALASLKNDPVGVLKQAGYNIPADISGNPSAMIQYLVNTGQIPKTKLQMFIKR